MNLFFSNIGNLKAVQPFAGGNLKFKNHINELRDLVEEIRKAAAQCGPWDNLIPLLDGKELTNFDVWENGVLVTKSMLAQTIAVNA